MVIIIMEPNILTKEEIITTTTTLTITHDTSNAIISWVQFLGIGLLLAVSNTNNAKTIKKTPTSLNGTIVLTPNNLAKNSGTDVNSKPVIPELIAFVNKMFFELHNFSILFTQKYFDHNL